MRRFIHAWHWMIGACVLSFSATASDWPEVALPRGATVDHAGDELKLNGIPMRISRFSTSMAYGDVVGFFRRGFGQRRVENLLSGDLLIGQKQGDHLITVRIRSVGRGTAGIVSISNMHEAMAGKARSYGLTLPGDSSVLSDLESVDSGKRSRQLLIANTHSVEANHQHFLRVLAQRNLKPSRSESTLDHRTVWLEGRGVEALLVIKREKHFSHVLMTLVNAQ